MTLSLSPGMASVGIVEWSLDVPVTSAVIRYGREAGVFEYEAPVDITAANYRTLLLGMKDDSTYHVQIEAQTSTGAVVSEVYDLATDLYPNGLPVVEVSPEGSNAALYGGFTITCTGTSGSTGMEVPAKSHVLILDKDGEYVWVYELTGTPVAACSRARMSYDGKHMWIGNFSNVSPDGALMRVSMDGNGEPKVFSLPGRHHDFSVLPNNHVLFHEQANGGSMMNEGPDIIKELDPETGAVTTIYEEDTDFSSLFTAMGGAHTNYITYVPHLNAISFSMRHSSTIGLVSYPSGQLLGIFGGTLSQFPMSWAHQHGHQVMEDTLLVFNNDGTNGGSSVIEFSYDLNAKTASKVFDYSSGRSAPYFGDVQRLPNGNTVVTYSPIGVIHEVDATPTLLREISMGTIGYTRTRKTLYGEPPPFGP